MNKHLDNSRIISLLRELDSRMKEPCTIILCGGAAAIVEYGLKRPTGDVDILEPMPKSRSFYEAARTLSECHGLDPEWINDGAKGFVDCLSPGFHRRLVPLNAGFSNLEAFVISKPDLITMKICAWRESDKQDVIEMGISEEDAAVIDENLRHVAARSPDRAHKAQLVLSELGLQKARVFRPEDVSTLAELILYFTQQEGRDPTVEDIRRWKDEIDGGSRPDIIAATFSTHESNGRRIGSNS